MPTYMGNVGHLMQHWTLCKLLTIAADEDKHIPGLNFIDAHAMAPLARVMGRRGRDDQFDGVRDRLPGQHSAYELAWHHLAPSVGYPNSAVFVEKVWKRDFALLLCETDWPTIAELGEWCGSVRRLDRCKAAELSPGDWRNRFDKRLPSPDEVGLLDGSPTLVSFDPYKYDTRRWVADRETARRPGDLYPQDLERVTDHLNGIEGPILVQLSTYALPTKDTTLEDVRDSVDGFLESGNLTRCCEPVRVPNRNMMSLIYARNVPWADKIENLPTDFTAWINGI